MGDGQTMTDISAIGPKELSEGAGTSEATCKLLVRYLSTLLLLVDPSL